MQLKKKGVAYGCTCLAEYPTRKEGWKFLLNEGILWFVFVFWMERLFVVSLRAESLKRGDEGADLVKVLKFNIWWYMHVHT